MSDDYKRWSTRKTVTVAVLASIGLWALILYIAGLVWPWDVSGEGYRGNE